MEASEGGTECLSIVVIGVGKRELGEVTDKTRVGFDVGEVGFTASGEDILVVIDGYRLEAFMAIVDGSVALGQLVEVALTSFLGRK